MPESRFTSIFSRTYSAKYNFLSNFLGTSFISAVSILLTPFYLRYIGIEAYGLIGFFTSVQAVLFVLDLGMSTTLNRELAVAGDSPEKAQGSRNLVRTLEAVYWGIAIVMGIVSVALSPLFASWVNPQVLTRETVVYSFVIMGVGLAFQFPISLYSGGLYGLQKHVVLTAANFFFGILRTFGALAVLHFISPSPFAFFIWQAAVSLAQVSAIAFALWMLLPKGESRAIFDAGALQSIWRFAGGLSGISILSILLTQADKLVLSRILPLETFGYYALAALVAAGLGRITFPIFQAYFPKMSQLVSKSDETALKLTYHQGCQLTAVAVLPLAGMLVFFPREILLLWQKKPEIVENTWLPLSLLMIGSALNALLITPYALQLAHARTKLYFYSLLIAVILLTPLTIIGAVYFGVAGAASVWVLLNMAFISVVVPLMHRDLLPDQKWKWFFYDVALPLAATVFVIWIGRILFQSSVSNSALILQLGVIFAIALFSASMSSSFVRNWLLEKFSRRQPSSNL